mgnify:CR=1 FL=1
MTVIYLDDYRAHIDGEAKCLACQHEWVAVAPTGTLGLDCPECGAFKGVFKGLTAPDTVWECTCGNSLFFISPEGSMCSICGEVQVF